MDAYQFLSGRDDSHLISSDQFYQLVLDFQNDFLKKEDFQERLYRHRNPMTPCSDNLQKLYKLDHEIQYRPEMRDEDVVNNTSGYVPSVIKELWLSDRRLKSLYQVVQVYCQLRNRDFNTVAAHMAEYRAVIRLQSRMRRQMRKYKEPGAPVSKPYTFEDWLENRFYHMKNSAGKPVANDSENDSSLVIVGMMADAERDKILAAQQQAYNYIITSTLRAKEQQIILLRNDASAMERFITEQLESTGNYFVRHQEIVNEVQKPRKYHSIDWGAKFMLPVHYKLAINKEEVDAFHLQSSPYKVDIDGQLTSFPTQEQQEYIKMEVQWRWRAILDDYRSKAMYVEMINTPDFKTLIEKYGGGDELKNQFLVCLDFAPDREVVIKEHMKNYESVMLKPMAGVNVRDWLTKQEIRIETGQYKAIGYAWVNGGHNQKSDEFRTLTAANLSINAQLGQMPRFGVYVNMLYNLAVGGAIALHLAFLRKELKKENATAPKVTRKTKKENDLPPVWQGSEAQRERLYNALVFEGYIEDAPNGIYRFFKKQPVKWLRDARALFYMVQQLKAKDYKVVTYSAYMEPLVNENFVNEQAKKFKNVNQSISGMKNSKSGGRPRLADEIDEILKQLLLP
jgi:hypothetical protein